MPPEPWTFILKVKFIIINYKLLSLNLSLCDYFSDTNQKKVHLEKMNYITFKKGRVSAITFVTEILFYRLCK